MSSNSRTKKSTKNKISSPATTPNKRKRPNTPSGSSTPVQAEVEGTVPQETPEQSPAAVESQDKIPVFKDPNFVHSTKGAAGSKKTRVWKNLKQIVGAEKSLPWKPTDVTSGSVKGWKTVKQILESTLHEKLLLWKGNIEQSEAKLLLSVCKKHEHGSSDPVVSQTDGSIEAPPSFKPAKKYSDLSGLAANYRDPETKLRYATAEEYSRIKMMPSDVVTGCLALRKATTVVP